MKHVVISLLAVAAFGVAVAGTQSAQAEGWVSSGWQPQGMGGHIGDGGNYEGFSASYWVGPIVSVPSGVTKSGANTWFVVVPGATNQACSNVGTSNPPQCPTTHMALTLCSNNDFLTGHIVEDFGGGGTSSTTDTTGTWAGYWSGFWTSAGLDKGYCPNNHATAGGMWLYQY